MPITFVSPTARRIKGVLHSDRATWRVTWGNRSDRVEDFDCADEGPSAEWDAVDVAGQVLFLDDEGDVWFCHHLLIDELGDEAAGAMPDEVVGRFRREVALAEAYQAAKDGGEAVRRALATATTRGSLAYCDSILGTMATAERLAHDAYVAAARASRSAKLAAL